MVAIGDLGRAVRGDACWQKPEIFNPEQFTYFERCAQVTVVNRIKRTPK